MKMRRPICRWLVSGGLFASFAFALVLAVSPQLHERLHHEASPTTHECAVTLITAGKLQHSSVPVVVVAPEPAFQFGKIPTLNPLWVPAPFLGAAIFEHAPPAFS
jgi:hypothetical protein